MKTDVFMYACQCFALIAHLDGVSQNDVMSKMKELKDLKNGKLTKKDWPVIGEVYKIQDNVAVKVGEDAQEEKPVIESTKEEVVVHVVEEQKEVTIETVAQAVMHPEPLDLSWVFCKDNNDHKRGLKAHLTSKGQAWDEPAKELARKLAAQLHDKRITTLAEACDAILSQPAEVW